MKPREFAKLVIECMGGEDNMAALAPDKDWIIFSVHDKSLENYQPLIDAGGA